MSELERKDEDWAVQLVGPGFQMIVRMAAPDGPTYLREALRIALCEGGAIEAKPTGGGSLAPLLRLGPGMYVELLETWEAFEARQKAAQAERDAREREAVQRQHEMIAAGQRVEQGLRLLASAQKQQGGVGGRLIVPR